jgi:MFS family permease
MSAVPSKPNAHTSPAAVLDPPSHAGGGMFAALHAPGYPLLWASGWLWNLTRWMAAFLGSYLIYQLTGSPLLVQLGGVAFYTPMLCGSLLGGVVSDRFDRRRTLLLQTGALVPVALLAGALALSGLLRAWMLFPYMLLIGASWVLDMTSRRALVYELVGPAHLTNAMALESVTQTGGALLGNLMAGAMLNFLGAGPAYLAIATGLSVAWLCLAALRPLPPARAATRSGSVRAEMAAGLRYVRGDRILLSIVGVTVLVNFCFYPYQTLVPVFADRLQVNALGAGVLAASAGLGSLVMAFVVAGHPPNRRGRLYLRGSAVALAGVLAFALSRWYPLSVLALMIAGAGQAGYTTMQSTLILSTATPPMRGRALGVSGMAIGVLPFALALVGVAAEVLGPVAALTGLVTMGLAGLGAWAFWARELRAVR